jgi:type IV pilus assembly protein PilN
MKNPFANLFKKKPKGDEGTPVPKAQDTKKKEGFFSKFFKNRLGKSAVQGEEIVGVELTPTEIRISSIID